MCLTLTPQCCAHLSTLRGRTGVVLRSEEREAKMYQDQKIPAGDDLTDAELDAVSGGGGASWSSVPATTDYLPGQYTYEQTLKLLYKAMGA